MRSGGSVPAGPDPPDPATNQYQRAFQAMHARGVNIQRLALGYAPLRPSTHLILVAWLRNFALTSADKASQCTPSNAPRNEYK